MKTAIYLRTGALELPMRMEIQMKNMEILLMRTAIQTKDIAICLMMMKFQSKLNHPKTHI